MKIPPVLNGRILISIFETLSPGLPSLRSREGMGVSIHEIKKFAIEEMCIMGRFRNERIKVVSTQSFKTTLRSKDISLPYRSRMSEFLTP